MYVSMLETEQDKITFQKLYEQSKELLYFAAWNILNNEADAEDAVHACFLKLAEKFTEYNHLSYKELENLCYAIVRNKAKDIIRRYQKIVDFPENEGNIEDLIADNAPGILEQLVKKYEKELVKQATMQLTETERHLLYLQYTLGYKAKEIGQIYGLSSEVIRKKMYKCRGKLAKILQEKEYQDLR